jgi:predicted ester cyclase
MGEAREVLDQMTIAGVDQHSIDAAVANYSEDAVLMTPDAGEIRGRGKIGEYWRPFIESFPDGRFEPLRKIEAGDTAIDEGWFIGTHTAPLNLPTGDVVPPTGRQVRVRSCDIATVVGGKIKEHHLYFDQADFLGQLGLAPRH